MNLQLKIFIRISYVIQYSTIAYVNKFVRVLTLSTQFSTMCVRNIPEERNPFTQTEYNAVMYSMYVYDGGQAVGALD